MDKATERSTTATNVSSEENNRIGESCHSEGDAHESRCAPETRAESVPLFVLIREHGPGTFGEVPRCSPPDAAGELPWECCGPRPVSPLGWPASPPPAPARACKYVQGLGCAAQAARPVRGRRPGRLAPRRPSHAPLPFPSSPLVRARGVQAGAPRLLLPRRAGELVELGLFVVGEHAVPLLEVGHVFAPAADEEVGQVCLCLIVALPLPAHLGK